MHHQLDPNRRGEQALKTLRVWIHRSGLRQMVSERNPREVCPSEDSHGGWLNQ